MNLKRQIRHTVFIYCEGKTDAEFAQYLKKLYSIRGTKHIKIKTGRGGDLSTFLSAIRRDAQVRDYDEKYILLDSNGKSPEELKESKQESQKHDTLLIWQRPCLEGVFLRVLNPKGFIPDKTSKKCKDIFYKDYAKHATLTTVLETLFTKTLMDKKRKEIPELNQFPTLTLNFV